MLGYCASKSAVNAIMEGLRLELMDHGLHVTTICPGWIRTAMTAQIAADLMPGDRKDLLAGLGFQALGNLAPGSDDRVDVLTRGVLGLTVACAQCHDHKYDPIPTKDYYSLMGVFRSTQIKPIPLAPPDQVAAWDARSSSDSAPPSARAASAITRARRPV